MYIAIPFIGLGLIGTMITDKYQVEHARIFVEIDANKKTDEQTKKDLKSIDKFEKELILQQAALIVTGIIFFLTATLLLLLRNKIIRKHQYENRKHHRK
jgi:prephenate dehydrogenase